MNQSKVRAENRKKLWTLLTAQRGKKCEMCGRQLTGENGDAVLHHRHYRTVDKNFNIIGELTGDELSILCFHCHIGLHYRHSNRILTDHDWNFVDPRWTKEYFQKRSRSQT